MLANFQESRWKRIRDVYSKWWDRTLERPVINVSLYGTDPHIEKPEGTIYPNLSQYGLSVPAETVAKHWEYILLCRKYLGDSYPTYLPDYGPGVNAAFMGCKARVTPETVWFEPERHVGADKLHFYFNPDEPVFRRIMDVYAAASRLFGGSAVLGMTHLNNGIDIVARFFGSVEMGMLLYDDPDNVKRLIRENHELMFRYFNEFIKAMGQVPGYSMWGDIYCSEPWIGAQSDFSAMIGPEQFEEFILPELIACFRRSKFNFYHLDGPGELPHLDMLCDIPELKCIQWVPGTGGKPECEWPEVYRKISCAGKNVWLTGAIDNIEIVADQIGTTKGIYWCGAYPMREEDRVLQILERHHAL